MAEVEDGRVGGRPLRILLIEDDRDVAELYRLGLDQRGYQVILARDGEEGLELAMALAPDLLLLDVRLPKLTGFQVLQHLRSRPQTRHIPVVVLSNYDAEELQQQGLELGAMEWLVKVRTTPADLIRFVEHWAGQRQGDVAER
jgi:DNA-binding response OmpR family regulator